MTHDDSNAVIAVQVANVDQKLDAVHRSLKEDVGSIKEEVREVKKAVRETNGRVSTHDKQIAFIRGAVASLSLLSPFVLFLLNRFL